MKKKIDEATLNKEFEELIKPIISHPNFQKQKDISHHHYTTVYFHTVDVARECYRIARNSKKKYDIDSLIKSALLHDFFLYNWRLTDDRPKPHGYKHPQIAYENAIKEYTINPKEENAIKSHMWPLTFFHFPKSKEAWLVCWADKKVTVSDFLKRKKHDKK